MVRPSPKRPELTAPGCDAYAAGMTHPLASNVVSGPALAEVAALMGDVGRATMLLALMDGRALTAGELARQAGVTPQTASGHLARLLDLRLVAMERQGRHRYHRLASADVASAIEGLMTLVGAGPLRHRPTGPRDAALRAARSCYDHLAGRLGVALADSLAARGCLVLSDGAGIVTERGRATLAEMGIALDAGGARPLCRTCLDWSERRPHVAGRLGAALLERSLDLGWVRRRTDGRALTVTEAGRRGYVAVFGVDGDALAPAGAGSAVSTR